MPTGMLVVFERQVGRKVYGALAVVSELAQALCYAERNLSSLVAMTTSADKVGDAITSIVGEA